MILPPCPNPPIHFWSVQLWAWEIPCLPTSPVSPSSLTCQPIPLPHKPQVLQEPACLSGQRPGWALTEKKAWMQGLPLRKGQAVQLPTSPNFLPLSLLGSKQACFSPNFLRIVERTFGHSMGDPASMTVSGISQQAPLAQSAPLASQHCCLPAYLLCRLAPPAPPAASA